MKDELAGDTYLSTATSGYSDTVVALVLKQVQAALRAGLVWTPRGSQIPATLVAGSNGTFRSVGYSDLPEDGQVQLEHGDADPDVEDLGIDFAEFTGKQYGRTVGVEDTAKERSPHNLSAIAAEKISRDINVAVDNQPRRLYAAAPGMFGGTSKDAIGEIAAGDKMTAALLKDAVAVLRSTDVPTLANGLYGFVADPFVVRDLQADDEYIEEVKFADPSTFLTGQIATYAGCAIIDAGSRGNVSAGAGTGSIDVHLPTLIGANAVFGAIGGLRIIPVVGPDKSDPLDRRDLYSWKAFLGAILNDVQAERFITLAVATTL
jgi:N4-gp56 family major capsid protein